MPEETSVGGVRRYLPVGKARMPPKVGCPLPLWTTSAGMLLEREPEGRPSVRDNRMLPNLSGMCARVCDVRMCVSVCEARCALSARPLAFGRKMGKCRNGILGLSWW